MGCQDDPLITKICQLFEEISRLESLKPSENVDMLFGQLVATCIPPNSVDVTKICKKVQETRSKLIRLCGEAEGYLETHYSSILGSFDSPLENLNIFPYYSNYLKLSQLEFNILSKHHNDVPNKIAFLGSGPLPLTSIVLAYFHLPKTTFHNYDIDPSANSMAIRLISSHPDLSKRMLFHTTDVINVTSALKEYDVVFLAALVGMDKGEKFRVIDHLAKHMAPGAILMLRSAHGARAFLYPIVDPCDLNGFEVLSVCHPTDEVINSVIIARKYPVDINSIDQQGPGCMLIPCNCSKMHAFHRKKELSIEEQLS